MPKKVVIIGGGAAGFFAAIHLAEISNQAFQIEIWEKSFKTLQKVKISGGGRCNFTNVENDFKKFASNYPRGNRELIKMLYRFSNEDMVNWLEKNEVKTKTEPSGKYFPFSNSSDSIIYLFEQKCKSLGIKIKLSQALKSIEKLENTWLLNENQSCDYVLIASGSSPSTWKIIENLGHEIIPAIPSLFTFKTFPVYKNLAGVSVSDIELSISATKNAKLKGDFIFTHQGISGPVVLKLSAFYAKELADLEYQTLLKINFVNENEQVAFDKLKDIKSNQNNKKIKNIKFDEKISWSLWEFLLQESEIELDKNCSEIGDKFLRKLALNLTKFEIKTIGKVTNKEEFVTAGGVSRKEIDFETMQSKLFPYLFFAGEVIDIDGVTGGFNFQNCWSGAYIFAEHLAQLSK